MNYFYDVGLPEDKLAPNARLKECTWFVEVCQFTVIIIISSIMVDFFYIRHSTGRKMAKRVKRGQMLKPEAKVGARCKRNKLAPYILDCRWTPTYWQLIGNCQVTCHTAYRHASLIDLYVHIKFH